MSVFVNQGPWPWPPGRTQTGPGPQGPAQGQAEYLAQRLA